MILDFLITILTDYTVRTVVLSTALLGGICGILGVFVLLRKQTMLGDAISHAALPGIALSFLLTHSRNPFVLLVGGSITGLIGAALVSIIVQRTSLKRDAVLGVVLSVFFGFGLVLITVVQKQAIASQAVLNKFLFGSASTLLPVDVYAILIMGIIVLCTLTILWKEFKVLTFDPLLAHTLGYNTAALRAILTALLVLAVVIGLQTVGVVLISCLLIAPAAAARQWCNKLESMALLAAVFGACSSIGGSLISSYVDYVPTGPMIVVLLSAVVFASLMLRQRAAIVNHSG